MWSSRLFWKMFLSYAALLLLAALSFVVIQSQRQRAIVFDQVRRRLHDSAIIVREYLGDTFPRQATPEQQQRFHRLAAENETRITLVAEDGSVVGDSSKDPRQMENHGSRDEIVQARETGTGDSQRLSPTLGIPMMYFAVRLGTPPNILGYVRVAMPMESVNEQVAAVEHLIWTTAMTGGLAALVLTYFVIRPVIKPLGLLTRAAQDIERGDLTHAVAVTNRDELGTLATAFNSMRQELALQIEELKRSRQDLEESSKLLETVLESMVEGVVVVDQERSILYANQAAHRLLDISAENVIGRPIWEIVRDARVLEILKAMVDHPVSQRIEFEIARTRSVTSLFASPLPGEPCAGVVLVLYDVTELRRLERVRQDFVSNVSHELKTPLTSIRAYTETLLNGALDDEEHNYQFLQQIEHQADRLEALIQDLMRLARIESERAAFEVGAISLSKTVAACLKSHQAIAEAKGLTLAAADPTQEIVVLADEEGLSTILDNLVDNAINYTPAGGRVIVRCAIEQSAMARIDVIDTGIGISLEHQQRIFERFYRVDKARSRELGGTGLGLSIVKHLTNVFDGSVEVTSEYGKGSTFTVRLPLAQALV